MKETISAIAENAIFVLEFLGIILLMFIIAYSVEKVAKIKSNEKERILSTKKIVVVGLFSAISAILMVLEFGLPFAPPGIYKFDFSELPALIVGFAYGPVAAVMTEFIKIVLKTFIKGTSSAFVGELANFVVGCSFVLPASIIYRLKKTKTNAVISCVSGTILITVVGSLFNAFYLVPTFASMYGMPVEVIVSMGTEVNANITDLTSFILWAVAPFNLLKGAVISVITMLIYKKLSPILKDKNK